MAYIQGKDVFVDVKMPKKRRVRSKETKPRNQPEALLRKEVIKHLREHGCKVWRIETAIIGQLGLPDLLVFSHKGMFWVELKSLKGVFSIEQEEFRYLCFHYCVKHITAR